MRFAMLNASISLCGGGLPPYSEAQVTEKADPKLSIQLLDELVRRGLDNHLYRQLHHSNYDTIKAHIRYCNKTKEFRDGETNATLQCRLRFLRDQIKEKFEVGTRVDSATFQRLVNAALEIYPLS